jgi:hypothetical protein
VRGLVERPVVDAAGIGYLASEEVDFFLGSVSIPVPPGLIFRLI